MEFAFVAAISIALITIAIQDFRNREFYWILTPVIFILGFTKGMLAVNLKYWFTITLINITIVVSSAILLYIYFFIARKRKNSVWELMGEGDFLLLAALSALVFPKVFIIIVIASSVAAIVANLAVKTKFGKKIPFAGWLSIAAIVSLVVDFIK